MSVERIIGIDFGTSTSVVRVKRYQDGKPLGDGTKTDTKEVIFGNHPTVPTVIQRVGGNTYYGHDALVSRRKSVTYQGFKVRLESTDAEEREEARELTAEFFRYLAKVYREQSNGGHLGDASDAEKTLISYPVKWSKETKAFMRETAAKAGFPNVEGMDEAEAAIHAVTIQCEHYLQETGYLIAGKPCTMLLIDMGAGTTDLVLCRYTPGENPKNDILCTWPQKGEILFGGQEVEEILAGYIRSRLPEEDTDSIMKRLNASNFKSWKEAVVSPALTRNEKVEDFSALETIISIMDVDVDDYGISRTSFEQSAADYLREFPQLVMDCVREAGISGKEIELVILTGGHSQWYFVKEILAGKCPEPCEELLPKIQREPERIIPVTRPQETVALGLVYSPMSAKLNSLENISDDVQREKPNAQENLQDGQTDALNEVDREKIEDALAMESKENMERYFSGDGFSDEEIRDYINRHPASISGIKVKEPDFAESELAAGEDEIDYYRKNFSKNTILLCNRYLFILKKDGSVFSADIVNGNRDFLNWQNIVEISQWGSDVLLGLGRNGKLCSWMTSPYKEGNPVEKALKWEDIMTLAIWDGADRPGGPLVCVKKDGSVALAQWDGSKVDFSELRNWSDIISLHNSGIHVVGLRKDGTVVACGNNLVSRVEKNDMCNVTGWTNICQIATNPFCTFGLRTDGTVVMTGPGADAVSQWRDMVHVEIDPNTSTALFGLDKDGKISMLGPKFTWTTKEGAWTGVASISSKGAMGGAAALLDDGRVVSGMYQDESTPIGTYSFSEVRKWSNMIAVICVDWRIIGLTRRGEILSTDYMQKELPARKILGQKIGNKAVTQYFPRPAKHLGKLF